MVTACAVIEIVIGLVAAESVVGLVQEVHLSLFHGMVKSWNAVEDIHWGLHKTWKLWKHPVVGL